MKILFGGRSKDGPEIPDQKQIEIIVAVVRWLLPLGNDAGGNQLIFRVKEEICKVVAGDQSWTSARSAIRLLLKRGYYPKEECLRGTILDFTSDIRLDLFIRTAVRMAHGFYDWKQSQIESVLLMWPAAEFYRAEEWDEANNWRELWMAAGGKIFPGDADVPGDRMIALKNSTVWERVNMFGLPHPPFDFNSGMDVRDIDADEAERLGLIKPSDSVKPQTRSLMDDLSDESELSRRLRARFGKLLALDDDYSRSL